ncbi:MAG TPA: hypothetical protein PKY82_03515 [Pyrinomonadaceae bacterium]|nr:hypothetical protein [Pyrinomonadaceae bacterium]
MRIFVNLTFTFLFCLAVSSIAFGQTTAGGTTIKNQANISYTEPNGGNVDGKTPQFDVTVSNVAGISITPDGGSLPSAVVGQTGIIAPFQVCSTGNFAETVTYPASGSAISLSGASATVTRAVIDVNGNGIIDAGDIDIHTNGAAVNQTLTVGACQTVLVEVTANAVGQINVRLGDSNGDNVPSDGSAGSLTASGGVNGTVEASGDYGVTGGTGIPVVSAPGVVNGPFNNAAAVGPTSNNDDFQEMTTTTGNNVPAGQPTTAAATIVFQNTLQNQGGVADIFSISAPTVPTGFTVEVSPNCSTYTTVSGGGSVALPSTASGATANYCVRVTAPAGTPAVAWFDTVVRATSGNNPSSSNDTIDRLYTGFINSSKTATVNNTTGVGGANDPVPGAVITYSISYQNISKTLAATNFKVTEDGNAAPNNWGSTTTQVVGSASDTNGGTIVGDSAGSNLLTDTVSTLAAQASGTFTFKRKIK